MNVPSTPPSPSRVDLRIATIGNVDAGKSTLVGALTRGCLDDGAGRARSLVFTHAHERETGRSSSVSTQIMVRWSDGGRRARPARARARDAR